VLVVPNHIDQGTQVIAVAVLDLVGVVGQLVGGDTGGLLGRGSLDAGEIQPHFTIDMHVVKRHGYLQSQSWLVALAIAARAFFRASSSPSLRPMPYFRSMSTVCSSR